MTPAFRRWALDWLHDIAEFAAVAAIVALIAFVAIAFAPIPLPV